MLQYERQQGRNPEAQLHNIPGFDVLSKERGLKPSRYIEVKGVRSGWCLDGVPLSVTQFEFAKGKGNQFWLYVVEYADDPDEVRIHPIQNPISHITQFRFDKGWQQLARHEKDFTVVLPRSGLRLRFRQENGETREGTIKSAGDETLYSTLQVAWDDDVRIRKGRSRRAGTMENVAPAILPVGYRGNAHGLASLAG